MLVVYDLVEVLDALDPSDEAGCGRPNVVLRCVEQSAHGCSPLSIEEKLPESKWKLTLLFTHSIA